MAKLAKAERAKGPFAGPDDTYPIPDKSHAKAALSGASHAEHVGNISKSEEREIDAKAHRKLGKTGSSFGDARDKQRKGD